MWERYFTANNIDQAIQLLSEHQGQARIIAGGTDLILELEKGLRPEIKTLIDVSRIPNIDQITLDEEGWIHLGPMVTHNHCAGSELIREHAFALARACWDVGAPQIRNRGTIAGNLITASPANDSITPLIALGAEVTLRSEGGPRVVPLEDFYTGVRQSVINEGELLTDIAFPSPGKGSRSTFVKLALRRAQAISVINVAVVLALEQEVVTKASVTLGAVAPTIIHAFESETFLLGKSLTLEVIEQAGRLAAEAAAPIDDLRGTAQYRTEMVHISTRRALRSLASNSERAGYPARPIMLWGQGDWHWDSYLENGYEHGEGTPIETMINGQPYRFSTGQNKTLLHLLRDEAGLIGSKEGCAEGECGACTVFLDGMAVMSCLVPAPRAHGAEIITIEGIGQEDRLHPIQRAFIEEAAVQCGYCTPGFIMSGAKLLEEVQNPTRSEIEQAITGNLCRCTGYYKIISALEKAGKYQQNEA